jgi:LPXTG-site transpeptidase (sortase) family protein
MSTRRYSYNEKSPVGTMLSVSAAMFFLTLSAFDSIGFVPSYIDGVYPDTIAISVNESAEEALPDSSGHLALSAIPQLGDTSALGAPAGQNLPVVEPTRIVIHAIGVDLPILNPTETNVAALDEALLTGAVRYPLSGKLNQQGNIFIFGHSSHIAFVKNQMFKAFNRLSELERGDTIKLVGDGKAYVYRVSDIRRADAGEEMIDLSPTQGQRLTLSTCDSFTGKTARFIVEADFIGSYDDE